MAITVKSMTDSETLKQELHAGTYFLVYDMGTGTFKVATIDVNVEKKNPDGSCEVRATRTVLPSGDARFKNFAQTNHKLTIEILAQKEQVKDPSLTRAQAVAKAEEKYASVAT